MRRLMRQILCEDDTGARYWVKVFINTRRQWTPSGTREVDGPEECWLDTGDAYRAVTVVEPCSVFAFVHRGRIVTLRRVQRRDHLPSFLLKPT